ncbi:MAG: 30S ribosomal protein S2 [Candidatus Schekmanbacteria bacterium RBG_13_48_7]|uniref:Small ribosomal subunit protein uS2 n=1 Tax=Candidatus Schekmanbacteria bacterium RBG_13_48_7 TaxID=1817878 RepID=A0A1F7RU02_9BACT|nr:MAG: 30S ribosomal protein S2 [Candidatus Schekmanbacteria bacterium RBG_13_48_7]
MRQLLEAGVHFGHQTKRWNPKMKKYIFSERKGIYIIDLQKTMVLFQKAYDHVKESIGSGGHLLFVGTKKQAQNSIKEEALRCNMYYVNQRWLGGTLTNHSTIKKSIDRLKKLEEQKETGDYTGLKKKEILYLDKERVKLEKNLEGIKNMPGLPSVVFVIDPKKEHIAVLESRKLGIPVISVVDTNCDPDDVDFVIPGNDDAIRAIKLVSSKIADAALEGKNIYSKHSEKIAAETGDSKPKQIGSEEGQTSVQSGKFAGSEKPGSKPNLENIQEKSKIESEEISGRT